MCNAEEIIDTQRFNQERNLLALELHKQHTQSALKQLHKHVLNLSGVKPVVPSPSGNQLRRILLDEHLRANERMCNPVLHKGKEKVKSKILFVFVAVFPFFCPRIASIRSHDRTEAAV